MKRPLIEALMFRLPVATCIMVLGLHAPALAQAPQFGPTAAASPVWIPAQRGETAPPRAADLDLAAATAGSSEGRIGLVAGALVGALAGAVYGRWLCIEHASMDASCAGPIILFGTGGGLTGALIGYVLGSGFD